MYIRRTPTSNSATGERYTTHRLVQSERVGGRVRQVTLLNLGRHFALPPEEWPALCARLEELRRGQCALLAGSGPVEREAQRLFARLLAHQGVAPPTGGPAGGDVQAVDVDSLELSRPRSVGVESVALWAMAQVQFVEQLQQVTTPALTVPAKVLQLHAYGLVGNQRETKRCHDAVPSNLVGATRAVVDELVRRYVRRQPPQNDDAWLLLKESEMVSDAFAAAA